MFEEDQLGEELGRGGYGTVFALNENPNFVVKISSKKSNCRAWSDEFRKIKNAMFQIENDPYYKKLKHVEILEPTEFLENEDGLCFMIMPRIYRPDNNVGPTLQALFGEKNTDVIYKGRGQFIGLKQIEDIIGERNVNKFVYELGIAMGLIHFVGKNDGYDVEVFLGVEYNSKKCKCYIADFDLTESVKTFDKETLERILWSLEAVQYFPLFSDRKLFDIFIKGYTEVGIESGINSDILDCIVDEYSRY